MSSRYIVELTVPELKVISQALHLRIVDGRKIRNAQLALESMSLQCDLVNVTPERHGVFPVSLTAPERAVKFKEIYFLP